MSKDMGNTTVKAVDLFVATVIGKGAFGTFRRDPDGSLHRVKSIKLPLRATREQAEADLSVWLGRKVYLGGFKDRERYWTVYDRRIREKRAAEATQCP